MDPSWLGDYYKFTALIQQLFVKVPKPVLELAVRKTAIFARSLVIPQHGADVFQVVAACAAEAPELSYELMLKPLIDTVTEDCKAMGGAATPPGAPPMHAPQCRRSS